MSDQQITCFDSLNHVDFTDLICCQLEKVNQIDIKEIKFKNSTAKKACGLGEI